MSNSSLTEILQFFKFQNQLKTIERRNWFKNGRRESVAEHSWSVAMIAWVLTAELEKEFGQTLDHNRIIKMALIHDIVEIQAGDVAAWDKTGRENIKQSEIQAIEKLAAAFPISATGDIKELWLEHEQLQTLESKLVKACDQLCPLIYRVVFNNDYKGTGVNAAKLDSIFIPIVSFSKTTTELYQMLRAELEEKKFFDN